MNRTAESTQRPSRINSKLSEVSESLVDLMLENKKLKNKLGAKGRQVAELTNTVDELCDINNKLAENNQNHSGLGVSGSGFSGMTEIAGELQRIQQLLISCAEIVAPTVVEQEKSNQATTTERPSTAEEAGLLECDTICSLGPRNRLVTAELNWVVGGSFRYQLQRVQLEALKIVELREFAKQQMACRGNRDRPSPLRKGYAGRLVEIFRMAERGERRLWKILKEATLLGICIKDDGESSVYDFGAIAERFDNTEKPVVGNPRTRQEDGLTEADIASIRRVVENRISLVIDIKASCRTAFTLESTDDSTVKENEPTAQVIMGGQEDCVRPFRVSEEGRAEDSSWALWTADITGLLGPEESYTRGPIPRHECSGDNRNNEVPSGRECLCDICRSPEH